MEEVPENDGFVEDQEEDEVNIDDDLKILKKRILVRTTTLFQSKIGH